MRPRFARLFYSDEAGQDYGFKFDLKYQNLISDGGQECSFGRATSGIVRTEKPYKHGIDQTISLPSPPSGSFVRIVNVYFETEHSNDGLVMLIDDDMYAFSGKSSLRENVLHRMNASSDTNSTMSSNSISASTVGFT